MYPIREIRRQQNVLDMASKVLTLALLLQVPILVIFASRMTRYFWTLPANVFWLLSGASSVLAIVGFTIVSRQLDLYDEAMADSPLPDLAQKTRLLGGGKIVVSVQLF